MIETKIYKPIYDEKNKINRLAEYSQLADWCNENNKRIVEYETFYQAEDFPEPSQAEKNMREIAQLKKYLNDTDWMVVKCLEQELVMRETYPQEYATRQSARERINELEN